MEVRCIRPLILAILLAAWPAGAEHRVSSTSYHACDGSGGLMADGHHVYFGAVASNRHPLGTLIRMVRPRKVAGRSLFRVRDRIGWGSELDFYAPSCAWMRAWGRRTVTYRVVR